MLAVLAFHRGEIPLVRKLAAWITELGGVKKHEIMLAPAWSIFMSGEYKEIEEALQSAFGSVSVMQPVGEDEYGWPDSANFAWRSVVSHVTNNLGDVPFFWFEPDSVPLCADWLDRIEAAWQAGGRACLGARVQLDAIPVHMTGIAVYHHVPTIAPGYALVQYQFGYHRPQVAWDVQLRNFFLPNATITDLIQHDWKPETFKEPADLNRIREGVVIYHQSKDGALIYFLRRRKQGVLLNQPPSNPDIGHCPEETLPAGFGAFTIPHGEGETIPAPFVREPFVDTVFTFFRPVDKIDKREQEVLIDLWMFSWRQAGWNPVMLDRMDSRNADLTKAFEALPTINPGQYDFNCFARWLAVADMGGGFMCDYDVMNNGLKPFPVPQRLTVYQTENACPSLVGGSREEFMRMARIFATRGNDFIVQENGHGAHVSDMHILQGVPQEYDQKALVRPYGGRGWGMAKAVHFANETMNGKKPRSKWIPHLMYQRDPR